uniref:Odorant receptor n=1 Tax=Adelphocoris lineolatus TaxID=236346 RepID=A0A2I4PH41_ADELI|nr:olfactory receptor 27 [Adelphocoris lineolatus]
MEVLHPNIVIFLKLMKSTFYWYDEDPPTSLWDRCRRIYQYSRVVLFVLLFIQNVVGLYNTDGFGIAEGSFLHFPVCIQLVVINGMVFYSRKALIKLTTTLNKHFIESNEPWMIAISNKYTVPLWKMIKIMKVYHFYANIAFFLSPFIADTILHYGFDALEKPFYMPTPTTAWMATNATWDLQYYSVVFLGLWSMQEVMAVVMGFIYNYSILLIFALIQLTIMNEKVKAMKLDGTQKEVDAEFKAIVDSHNDIIRLNADLKSFLGVQCAFQSLFSSFTITLCLFTATQRPEFVVRTSFAWGAVFYASTTFIYCSLGQLLENKSSELFYALYDLPWYRCSPKVRKDLNMIMRQSHNSLLVDYHGHFKMNFESYMQIIQQAYSYFTLLNSMAG